MPSRSLVDGPLVVLNPTETTDKDISVVVVDSSTPTSTVVVDPTGNYNKGTETPTVAAVTTDLKSQSNHKISPPTTPTKKIKSATIIDKNNINRGTSLFDPLLHQPMVLITNSLKTTTAGTALLQNGKGCHNQQEQQDTSSNGSSNTIINNGSLTSLTKTTMSQYSNGFHSNHLLEPYHHSQRSLNDEDDYSSENEYLDENSTDEDCKIYRYPSSTSSTPTKAKRDEQPIHNLILQTSMNVKSSASIITNATPSRIPVATNKTLDITPEVQNGAQIIYDQTEMPRPKKIYKVVLTGGPCGGKTTGQARLCTFFENLGWKVFRVPESATVLLSGGIKFSELSEDQAFKFQDDLLKTMMHIESVFFSLAETVDKDVLIICDRGTMDASAFIPRDQWEDILNRNGFNEVDIRDSRYNHIIHMVSAANGAEPFYTVEDHTCRSEGIELACRLDQKAAQAWVGHPYFDVVDNSTDFETKVCRMIQCICQKLGIDARDRLQTNSRKVKYLVKSPLPSDLEFPPGFQDFQVVHDYLQTTVPHPKMQARLRKRGQNGNWSYTYTVRRPELQGQVIEVKTALTQRDYNNMLTQKDHNHVTIYKTRRCFLLNDQYFQLDIYNDPLCHPRCKGLILLETYSTLNGIELQQRLPDCLTIVKEVTGDPRYSMFNLSLKDKWENNKNFCLNLAGSLDPGNNGTHQTSESKLTGP